MWLGPSRYCTRTFMAAGPRTQSESTVKLVRLVWRGSRSGRASPYTAVTRTSSRSDLAAHEPTRLDLAAALAQACVGSILCPQSCSPWIAIAGCSATCTRTDHRWPSKVAVTSVAPSRSQRATDSLRCVRYLLRPHLCAVQRRRHSVVAPAHRVHPRLDC